METVERWFDTEKDDREAAHGFYAENLPTFPIRATRLGALLAEFVTGATWKPLYEDVIVGIYEQDDPGRMVCHLDVLEIDTQLSYGILAVGPGGTERAKEVLSVLAWFFPQNFEPLAAVMEAIGGKLTYRQPKKGGRPEYPENVWAREQDASGVPFEAILTGWSDRRRQAKRGKLDDPADSLKKVLRKE